MVTITESREVCDLCRNPRRKVKSYRVGIDGLLVSVHLCKEDAKPIEELIRLGSVVPFPSSKVKVWDVEEIERRKREQQKAAPGR